MLNCSSSAFSLAVKQATQLEQHEAFDLPLTEECSFDIYEALAPLPLALFPTSTAIQNQVTITRNNTQNHHL